MENEKIELLKDSENYFNKLILETQNIGNLIQKGNEIEALKAIPFLTEGIDYICNVIYLTRDIHCKEISTDELNSKIKDIIDAIENEDMVLVGDLFNYELLPLLNSIKEKVYSV